MVSVMRFQTLRGLKKLTEPTVYPNSWKTIVEKHSDFMANENPDHGWYYRERMENLAEELWMNIMEDSN